MRMQMQDGMPPEPDDGIKLSTHIFLVLCVAVCLGFGVWAWYGELDIVSVATGEAKPASQVKEVQQKTNLEDDSVLNKQVLADLSKTGFESTLQEEAIALNESTDRRVANSYQAKIYNQVRSNWSRPPSARNGMQTKLLVELIPTGEVMSVSIIESSGVLAFDRSAEQAVKRSGKFEVPDDNQLFEEYFRRFYFLFKPEDLLR